MKSALMIGNGLNRCYEKRDSPIAWSNLLKKFAKDNHVTFHSGNSFPLEFECLINDICDTEKEKSSEVVISEAKKAIIQAIASIQLAADPIHRRFMELGIDEIITTNYDYYLEKVCDAQVQIPKGRSEKKYSLNRNIQVSGKRFHHIHGEANYPNSICLGYEHYAGTVQHMRDYAITKNDFRETLAPENASATAPVLPGASWIDLMFTHDVYIVGLNLGLCEIDLWWLLTYRAFLYYLNPQGRANIKNTITFYDTTPHKDEELKYQQELFSRMHVDYVYIPHDWDFISAFEDVAKRIESMERQKNAL